MYIRNLYIWYMSNQQLIKGSLSTIILKLLKEQNEMYGYEITQKVKLLTDGEIKITEGALYPALHKLEADGLLTTESRIVDNRVRKYYSLTKKGTTEIATKLADLENFFSNLQKVLNPNWKLG
jgi:PadR family transcriptional regulator PadR